MEKVSEISNNTVATAMEQVVVENPLVETQTTDVVAEEEKSILPEASDDKSLFQEILEWIVLALVIGIIWKGIDAAIKGIKKLWKNFKEKRAAKKAQATQQTPVAQVAAPAAEGKKEEAQAPQA